MELRPSFLAERLARPSGTVDEKVDLDPKAPYTEGRRLRWWLEVAYIGAFYAVYTAIRNTQGSARVGIDHAFHNATRLIKVERLVGVFHEESLQDRFLPYRGFIQFWNVYYGTFHFFVTLFALVWCYRCLPGRYPRMRNALLATTGLALIGFATFPLMPPRLLPPRYGFVDTLATYGGLWSFDSGAISKLSNQYAAMPSLHFGWSAWCVVALWPWARTKPRKALLLAYPACTTFAIAVTANHYFFDAAGGAVVLIAGFSIALSIARFGVVNRWKRYATRPDDLIAGPHAVTHPHPHALPHEHPAAQRPTARDVELLIDRGNDQKIE